MKKETREKIAEYDVFIANDGTEFDNENDCIYHDKLLSGEIKICSECNGKGYTLEKELEEDYHSGAPYLACNQYTCQNCNGKGYLEKTIVWK